MRIATQGRIAFGRGRHGEVGSDNIVEIVVASPFDGCVVADAEVLDAVRTGYGFVAACDVIRNDVDNDFHVVRMCACDQRFEFLESPGRVVGEIGIDVVVVLDRVR